MGATSTIRLICPNLKCRSLLSVPVSARGKTVRCRQCGARMQVPATRGGTPRPAPAEDESTPAS